MSIKFIDEIDIKGKSILLRQDLNVPISAGKVTSDSRIIAALETIKYAINQGAGILVISHLGRPKEGEIDSNLSLKPIAKRLSEHLGKQVRFEEKWIDGIEINPGEVVLGENVRFLEGEKANTPELSKKMANIADIYVMDAFATAHRSAASTDGVAKFAKEKCGGFLLKSELKSLNKIWEDPKPPIVAIVGGAKVSTKLGVLKAIIPQINLLIPGGGIANTLLAAKGFNVGDSLYEPDMVDSAKEIFALAEKEGVDILLPSDVVVGNHLAEDAITKILKSNEVTEGMILDIGPKTSKKYKEVLMNSGTIIWNGPVGVFEFTPFAAGTKAISEAVAESSAFSVAGGGDTVAAIEQFEVTEGISYISTGGGAFLCLLEGKPLPALIALEN